MSGLGKTHTAFHMEWPGCKVGIDQWVEMQGWMREEF